MIRRNRKPNWRRIKTLRSYTIDEAAKALGVHRNTIRHWIKKSGLRAFTDQRPHLIQGGDLVACLQGAASKRRCGPGQFYCVKCRQPQRSAEGMVDYEPVTAGDFNIRPTHLHESLRRAMVELLVNALRKEEFCRQLEDMLLDEFADERRQAVADRSLDPDA